MEGLAAYVIAADSLNRIRQFLIHDTRSFTSIQTPDGRFVRKNQSDISLSSSSPVILIVEDDERSTELSNYGVWRVLRTLWRRHQSFRGFVITKSSKGNWRSYVGDPLADEAILLAGNPDGIIKNTRKFVNDTIRDLGAYTIHIFPALHSFVTFPSKEDPEKTTSVVPPSIYFIFVLKEKLKFNIRWRNYATKGLKNVPKEKIMNEITKKELDFSMTDLEEDLSFEYVAPLESSTVWSNIVVLVQRSGPLPAWSLPVRVFGRDMWLSFVACLLAYALAWRVVTNESLGASAAAALRAFSSCGGTPQDRVSSTAQRLMLSGALLASGVVIVAAYQGRLYTLQVNLEHFRGIEDLKEVLDSEMPLFTQDVNYIPIVEKYIKVAVPSRNNTAHLNIKCEFAKNIVKRIQEGETFAWVVDGKDWELLQEYYHYSKKWKVLQDSYISRAAYMHVHRNFPWRNIVNSIILQCTENGLWQHWKAIFKTQSTILFHSRKKFTKLVLTIEEDPQSGPFTFTVEDLAAHFHFLLAGLILSLAAYLMELFQEHISK